jgi:hypothetical protein
MFTLQSRLFFCLYSIIFSAYVYPIKNNNRLKFITKFIKSCKLCICFVILYRHAIDRDVNCGNHLLRRCAIFKVQAESTLESYRFSLVSVLKKIDALSVQKGHKSMSPLCPLLYNFCLLFVDFIGSMSIVGVTQNGNTGWSGTKLLHFSLKHGTCEECDYESG